MSSFSTSQLSLSTPLAISPSLSIPLCRPLSVTLSPSLSLSLSLAVSLPLSLSLSFPCLPLTHLSLSCQRPAIQTLQLFCYDHHSCRRPATQTLQLRPCTDTVRTVWCQNPERRTMKKGSLKTWGARDALPSRPATPLARPHRSVHPSSGCASACAHRSSSDCRCCSLHPSIPDWPTCP